MCDKNELNKFHKHCHDCVNFPKKILYFELKKFISFCGNSNYNRGICRNIFFSFIEQTHVAPRVTYFLYNGMMKYLGKRFYVNAVQQ